MSKRYFVSLATMLVAANLIFGMDPVAPPEALPAPTAIAQEEPFLAAMNCAGGIHHRLSAEAEYVFWFPRSSIGSFPVASLDALGQTTALGSSNLIDKRGPIGGGRFAFGYWEVLDNAWVPEGIKDFGAETRFFFTGRRSVDVTIDTPPVLFRPFFDLNNRTLGAALVASPGLATGFVSAHGHAEIWGAEANAWKNVYFNSPGTNFAIRVMGGLRYLNATSALDISATSVFNPTIDAGSIFAPFAGNRLFVLDSFSTDNHFLGGQIGIGLDGWFTNYVNFETSLRLAIGNTNQNLTVVGSQIRTLPTGATIASQGGLLALPSNMGKRSFNKFTQVPEIDVKFKIPIGSHLTLSSTFSAMYWNRILRATERIDRSIDITQIPNFPAAAGATPTGLGRPGVSFRQSDLWLLGASIGAEICW